MNSQIQVVPGRCGCAGKTPLDRIVRPALASLRADAVSSVRIAGELEAGLLPNTERFVRTVVDEGSDIVNRRSRQFVATAFVDRERGSGAGGFRSLLDDAYGQWAGTGDATILKGHSIQIESSESVVWGESIAPVGRRTRGYRAVNVDVIHALPGVTPTTQANVAALHAFNDCFTQGAATDRDLRPIVGVPGGTDLGPERVRRWYCEAVDPDVTVRAPSIVVHDGRGWQFGASVAATTTRTPPVRTRAIEPGDELLVHRPLGALALYTGCVDVEGVDALDTGARALALERLTTDHAPVAAAIEACCPHHDEGFDPDRHLKWAGDVSGPGVRGLLDAVGPADCGIAVESIPLVDRDALDAVRNRWIVPDVTVETNGPIAAIGTPSALDRFERHLEDCQSATPDRIGVVTDTPGELRWAEGTDAWRYLEAVGRPSQ